MSGAQKRREGAQKRREGEQQSAQDTQALIRLALERLLIELKARKRGAGWVTLWDHALDRDRGFFFFPFKNPRNSYSAQAQQRLPAAVVQDAAVDLANKLCVRKDAGAPG